jgi:hypothetical protein
MQHTSQDVARLLNAAAQASTLAEQESLVKQATEARQQITNDLQRTRSLDLMNTVVAERMQPVAVHSHHTAATDWLAAMDTSTDPSAMQNRLVAEATLWYGRVSDEVKADAGEFAEQARGRAHHLAGSFGEGFEQARAIFTDQAAEFRTRDLKIGTIREAGSGLPQVGEPGNPGDGVFPAGNYETALPLEATTSERAPQIQELEANNGPHPSQDVVPVNDPALGQSDPSADLANGDAGTQQDGSKMNNNQRSASRHEAYSGLDQVQQVIDPSDTHPQPTPLPEQVAFPIVWDNGGSNVNRTIQEAEQQIAQRDQRRGASLRALEAAKRTYAREMTAAGYDASGWAGDMGAQGYGPGEQEGPPPPGHNLGEADPVYGYGGDQGDQPEKPYGAQEADDYTNNPGMNYQPGGETHYDTGGRGMSTATKHADDPEIKQAMKFIAQRTAWLERENG